MKSKIPHLLKNRLSDNPLIFLDAGFSPGINDKWRPFKKFIKVIGFDPQIGIKEEFDNSNHELHSLGLYSKKARMTFYHTQSPYLSSFLKPNKSFLSQFPDNNNFKIVKSEKIKVDKLDSLLKNKNFPDLIKLDTQGTELEILKGAKNILNKSILGIEVEIEFKEIYEKQPLFDDIHSFLNKFGFDLFDLRHYYWKRKGGFLLGRSKGQIVCADALYFKNSESFKNILKRNTVNKIDKIFKVLFILCFYGYYD